MQNKQTNKMENLTELETLILNGIKPFPSYGMDCTVELLENEIWEQTKIDVSPKQIRGAMASLVKKDLIAVEEGRMNLI